MNRRAAGARLQPGSRSRAAALAAAVVASLVFATGCANLAPLPPATADASISGRLAVRVEARAGADARAFSAAFDLRGDAHDGVLGLSTPLGSLLARASWKPAEVVLVTPQETRRFTDLDALTRELIGESIPLEAWFDWLHGRPWPGAPSAMRSASAGTLPATGAAADFEQLGWAVDLSRLGDGRVVAVRERPAPVVTVRIQLDRS